MLKFVLLGFLQYKPLTGYELESWIKSTTSHFWHAGLSQIYMTLKKLEEDALVISHIEPQEGRPDRRVYRMTEAGRADLSQWLVTPITEPVVKKDALLLKLFFASPDEKEFLLTQLRVQRSLHQQQLAYYRQSIPQEIQDMLAEKPELARNALLWDAARRCGEQYEGMYLRWLDETIQTIEAVL